MSANILKMPKVRERTALSRSTIYKLVAQGSFPKQISLSQRSVGWLESEVNDWIERRVTASRAVET